MRLLLVTLLVTLLLTTASASAEMVRFATFNSALSRDKPGQMLAELERGSEQARAVAAVIQTTRPHVLVLQEFDHGPGYDPDGRALDVFRQHYLAVAQDDGSEPIAYDHVYLVPSNTGVPTGFDLTGSGTVGGEMGTPAHAADSHGWGHFPGHYAFVVLSQFPIDYENVRLYGDVVWAETEPNHIPPDYYPQAALDVLRLSSKNHAVVPIDVNGTTVAIVAAHPTPPVFDGPEDRNGRRNHDEIMLIARILDGLDMPAVVLGDLNSDPSDGDSFTGAADPRPASAKLLEHPRLHGGFTPISDGGRKASERAGGVNPTHRGDPAADTSSWNPNGPGNLRVDYAVATVDLGPVAAGVFWPEPQRPLADVVQRASDHRLVWVDILVP